MNYGDTELKQVHCHDFIPMFEQQYQDYKWIDVQVCHYLTYKWVWVVLNL
jgi:hypothetical protein